LGGERGREVEEGEVEGGGGGAREKEWGGVGRRVESERGG